jgi:hypothetical protein
VTARESPFVSTGRLPPPPTVQALLKDAHERYRGVEGKGALGTFAPPLDDAGNSVRGSLAAAFLSRRLGLNVFASGDAAPESAPAG